MTTLAELLVKCALPKNIHVSLDWLLNPDTGNPVSLTFRVPSCVEVVDLCYEYRGRSEFAAFVALIARCFDDTEDTFLNKYLQEACAPVHGRSVDRETVIARVFRPEQIVYLAGEIFKAAGAEPGTALDDEILETVKNS